MKDKIIIVGAGGHGKVVCDIAKNYYKHITFVDDDKVGKKVLYREVSYTVSQALELKEKCDFFIAIGNNASREKIFDKFIKKGFNPVSLIHPSAIIGEDVELGIGTVIMAGAVINPCAKIGVGCIINTMASVDHDCNVGEFNHLCPSTHFAGTVKTGKGCTFGIGTKVINNVDICDNANFGAGAVVVKDITCEGLYLGIPAKKK